MNFSAIKHEPKSALSYAYDKDTLHIRLKTDKNDVTKVELLAVDPFNWVMKDDGSGIYEFDKDSVVRIDMVKEQVTRYHDCWFVEINDITWKRLKYCFILENSHEKYILGSHDAIPYSDNEEVLFNLFNYYNYPYLNEEDIYHAPEWVSDTIWYQIFPERFCNGSPEDGRDVLPWGSDEKDGYHKKFGGNLLGIIQKLDYIKESGFNGIYLNPIFESPSSHKYDTTDYFKIDPEFGDNETFGILVEEAHKRGIRVMLDAVFNHCGFFHPFWQDVLEKGIESKYYDCFYILDPLKPIVHGELKDGIPGECDRSDLNYHTFAYTQNMPKWNTGNPIVRKHLMDIGRYWVENYNIDGWRLDVSNEVSHDFWREFRKNIKSLNKDVYILGENWDNSYPWLMGDQFDAVMNYEFSIPIWNYFRDTKVPGRKYNGKEFQDAISELLVNYPKHLTENLFNLLDSHDTERFLNVVGSHIESVKLAYILLLTFPGSPCIYYGSEIGMGGGEHSNRQCMIWEEEKQELDLYTFIRKLIEKRKEHESFRTANLQWIALDADTDTILYKKETDTECLYVLLHKSESEINVKLPNEMSSMEYYDCITDANVVLTDFIHVDPFGYHILLKKGK
jgi:glycosidase